MWIEAEITSASMAIATTGCARYARIVGIIGADMGDDGDNEKDHQRHVGNRGDPLAPEGLGAAMGGA